MGPTGSSSTRLRHTGRRAATTSTESRGVNGVGQRAAQASVEHGEYGRDKSRPARPARHQFRYKTLPTRAGRPLFRYKTRPTRAGRPLFRYKTRPARPKWPNLARFPLAGRVLSRFHRQQTTQGEFSPAPAPPHHGHERNNTPTTQFRMQFQLSRTPYQHGGLVWFCGPGVLRVVGCYWWCCAHWRAYWLGESQPSALWGCSSL